MRIEEKILGSGFGKGGIIAYHRTAKTTDPNQAIKVVESIVSSGFKPGGGAMYGVGLYATTDLRSQFDQNMTGYGSAIIRYAMSAKGYLVFDYRIAKKLFGQKYTLIDQLLKSGTFRDVDSIPMGLQILSDDLEMSFTNPKLSADRAYNIWTQCYVEGTEFVSQATKSLSQMHPDVKAAYSRCKDKYKNFYMKKRIMGIVFSGNHDGNVIVTYFPQYVKPIAFCVTDTSKPNDPKALLVPWTSLDSKVTKQMLLGDTMASLDFLRGSNSIDEIWVEDSENITPNESVEKVIKAAPELGSSKVNFKGLDVAIYKDKFYALGGRWLGGDFVGEAFGHDPNIRSTLGSLVNNFPDQAEFFMGSFKGNLFGGVFRGGKFEKGTFLGLWEGGVWVHGPDAFWASTARMARSGKSSILYKGQLFELDKNPTDWVKDHESRLAAAEQGKDYRTVVSETDSFSSVVLRKMKEIAAKVEIDPTFEALLGNSNSEKMESLLNKHPWLFDRRLRARGKLSIKINAKGEVQLVSGALLYGEYFFDWYGPDVTVWGGKLLKEGAVFGGAFSEGYFVKGIFEGTWYGGIWGSEAVWGSSALTNVHDDPKLAKLGTRFAIGTQIVPILPEIFGEFGDIGDIQIAIRNGTYAKFISEMQVMTPAQKAKLAKPTRSKFVKGSSVAVNDADALAWEDDSLEDEFEDDLDKILGESAKLNRNWVKLVEDTFTWDNLSQAEQDQLYDEFVKSYEKATGAAFNRNDFERRARGWEFYGSTLGGISIRRQNSGGIKLVASFGGIREIVMGFQELMAANKGKQIWGMMTPNLVKQITKLSRGEFKTVPGMVVKAIAPALAKVMGGEIKQILPNGNVMVDTPAGVMEKQLVGNKKYFEFLISMAEDPANAGKIPIPQAILKPLVGILKMALT